MRQLLIPLDYALPTILALLRTRGDEPFDTDACALAETLRRCDETGDLLVSFAVSLAGRPCRQ